MFTHTTEFTMRFPKLLIIATALFAICASSCKKDEDESLPYLNGTPDFDLPLYGQAGDKFTFKAKGSTDDDGNNASYYWYALPIIDKRDTTDIFTLTLPDTLCTVTVTCGSFKKGYYGYTTEKSITIVNPSRTNGSIKGVLFNVEKDFVFTDERDGHEYWCTTIGDKDWFKDNLAFSKAGYYIADCPVTAGVFGKVYNWEEARNSCPEGWRLSTLQDWADAAGTSVDGTPFDPGKHMYSVAVDFMGNITFNGERMWEYWPGVRITDSKGLSMMPVGYATINTDGKASFASMNDYSVFWTADEKDQDKAYYRYIYSERPDVLLGSADKKSFAASVRCVRDHKE